MTLTGTVQEKYIFKDFHFHGVMNDSAASKQPPDSGELNKLQFY